jgi:hypothetical protein
MPVIFHGVINFAWFALAAIGLRMLVTGPPVVGFTLAALGSISLALSVRRSIRAIRQWPPDPSADLPSEEYDYIIWTAFAVPLLLGGLLLLLLISGGLASP